MNASAIPDHIQVKLDHAQAFHLRIKETCLTHIDAPSDKHLKRISVYMGEMSQAIRSALNNTMWDFCETKIKPAVSQGEYNKIRWSHDFPLESENLRFVQSKTRALRNIAQGYPAIYQFLESVQPYHKDYEFLASIRVLSNDTSHTIPVQVRHDDIRQMLFPGASAPSIRGNEVVVQWSPEQPATSYTIPAYVDKLTMYIATDRTWHIFLMSTDGRTHFSPTPFSKMAPSRVSNLLTDFYALG